MTREELKRHCLKQIEMCEMWARLRGEETHRKIYEEHKLILELLEQEPVLDRVRAEISDNAFSVVNPKDTYEYINVIDLDSIDKIFNKYKSEIDPHESEDNNAEDSN